MVEFGRTRYKLAMVKKSMPVSTLNIPKSKATDLTKPIEEPRPNFIVVSVVHAFLSNIGPGRVSHSRNVIAPTATIKSQPHFFADHVHGGRKLQTVGHVILKMSITSSSTIEFDSCWSDIGCPKC